MTGIGSIGKTRSIIITTAVAQSAALTIQFPSEDTFAAALEAALTTSFTVSFQLLSHPSIRVLLETLS